MVTIHEGKYVKVDSIELDLCLSIKQGYEQYIPEWFERKIDAEVAFQKHLTELGFEIVQLRTYHQEYFFESFNTATGTDKLLVYIFYFSNFLQLYCRIVSISQPILERNTT